MTHNFFLTLVFYIYLLITNTQTLEAQSKWQQKVNYTICVEVDDINHKLNGVEKVEYFNNSQDRLNKIYIHLYWNAFQPNSSMDNLSLSIKDPDRRVMDRISKLYSSETGIQKIKSIKVDNQYVNFKMHETILEVRLLKPILPNTKTNLEIEFESQIPIQIRRSGRFNKEGIMYSIAQWYPKICAYDSRGWHPNQYVGREFYGQFGTFDVNIFINKKHVVASTGIQKKTQLSDCAKYLNLSDKNKKLWRFVANNVNDFVWASDTGYLRDIKKIQNEDLEFNFYYKPKDSEELSKWRNLENEIEIAYSFIKRRLGKYEYKKYSFIQGGDGGMEYGMATLIKNANLETALHEFIHSWFQGMLGNNETDYAWLDEGFTTFLEHKISYDLKKIDYYNLDDEYESYIKFINSDYEDPMSTSSDFFHTNSNYRNGSYVKGALLLQQLGFIVGENLRDSILKVYVEKFKFKHPEPNDFFKVAEDVSNIQLKWLQNLWINTSKKIDYGIKGIVNDSYIKTVTIQRIEDIPMPIQIKVLFEDNSEQSHYIPLSLMLETKKQDIDNYIVHKPWIWTNREYTIEIKNVKKISKVFIEHPERMADCNSKNNVIELHNGDQSASKD